MTKKLNRTDGDVGFSRGYKIRMKTRFHALLLLALPLCLGAPVLAAPVPTPAGTFAFGTGSLVKYTVTHKMHTVHGQASRLEGQVKLGAGGLVTPLRVTLALTDFRSGNRNRDANALAALDALRHPDAVLAITGYTPTSQATTGQVWNSTGTASGTLTLRGLTKPVRVPVSAAVTGDTLTLDAAFTVKLADHAIPAPALLFVPVEDAVPVQVHGVAQRIKS